jgi:hypothetical protein
LTWLDGTGANATVLKEQRLDFLEPKALVVNATATRGVLRLPTGDVLTWTFTVHMGGESGTEDHNYYHDGSRWKQVYTWIQNYARLTGTLAGVSFDTYEKYDGIWAAPAIIVGRYHDKAKMAPTP